MKQMMRIGTIAVVLLMAIACKESPVEQWLNRAEACMETNADSSCRCLQYVEGLDGWSEEQRARYALLYTQAKHKCHIPLEDDSLINTAVAYYDHSADRHRLALSLLYKGLVHKQCGEVEQAVESFVGSEQAFEGVEDNQYKALLFNHYALVLKGQAMYEESLEYFKKSYQYDLLGDSVHYVLSACGQISLMYELLGLSDSAQTYYERGLSYADNLSAEKREHYYYLLQDYATFLMGKGEYAEAERLLLECLENITDSQYLHSLYSALATFYIKKRDYETALTYGRRVVESKDSLTLCGGYLCLYYIYMGMGEMDSVYHYHDLYRWFDSDITQRRRTAKVAVIPHRMKAQQLVEENRALTGWRMWLVIGLLVVMAGWWGIYRTTRSRHRREQMKAEHDLAVKESQLESAEDKFGKTTAELGRLKGAMTNHREAVDRMKQERQTILDKHRKEIEELKTSVKELKEEICDLRNANRVTQRTEADLKQALHKREQELKSRISLLAEAEQQREIDRRIENFMAYGRSKIAVDMLLQLRLKKKVDFRYDIRKEEYPHLMMQLLEQENPALHARLEQCELEQKKRTLCCMIALGLDDLDMMADAVCLSVHTVKNYSKECRELVERLKGGCS